MTSGFEWDEVKNRQNQTKHGVSFELARQAFFDEHRVIREDATHSSYELRYFCFGRVEKKIITVRFTLRDGAIRILGAAYWRKGKKIYETDNAL